MTVKTTEGASEMRVRVPARLKVRLVERARLEHRTLNGQILYAIERMVGDVASEERLG
jgi:hypothetical protein